MATLSRRLFLPGVGVALTLWAASFCGSAWGVEPTFADVAYGPYDSNKLDFWKAPSDKPTPVIVEIHGGGFYEGDKSSFGRHQSDNIERCLGMGVSVAAINYRFIKDAPLQDIERDAARAIQFLRFNAAEWNIDKDRIASYGDSAGAGTSLWLAFHDDLADPSSSDPVLRESTRLKAAGALEPQATYDFARWPTVLHIPQYIWYIAMWSICPKYYHFSPLGAYMRKGLSARADLDMLAMLDAHDPPVYLRCDQVNTKMTYANLGRLGLQWAAEQAAHTKTPKGARLNFDILHHPLHTYTLEAACKRVGVPCVANYRDTPAGESMSVFDFLLREVTR